MDNSILTELNYITWNKQGQVMKPKSEPSDPVEYYPLYYSEQHLAEDFVYFADLPEEQEELTIDE